MCGVPYGGEKIEVVPAACPSGHRWIVPRPRGQAPTVLIGTEPCSCTGGGERAHRSYHCETPGCPTPWTLQPPCSGDGIKRAIHT